MLTGSNEYRGKGASGSHGLRRMTMSFEVFDLDAEPRKKSTPKKSPPSEEPAAPTPEREKDYPLDTPHPAITDYD
jgi:hypothetical protein